MCKRILHLIVLGAITSIILVHFTGCSKTPGRDYQRITIDWNVIRKNPDHPIQSCSFYICSEVKLTLGPFEEIVDGKKYYVMEGYENGDINTLGDRVFKFMICRKSQADEAYSVLLDSLIMTETELLNFSGQVAGVSGYREGEGVVRLAPGNYAFEIAGNQ